MKKASSIMLVLAAMFLATTAFGQDHTFKVLARQGTNQVKKAGAAEGEPLKAGMLLYANDQLIVGTGGYIGLMHKSGKTIEVREVGTFKISDLEKKVDLKTESVSSKYAQFIASKVNDDGTVSMAQRSQATGAVSRAAGSAAITVILPSQTTDVLGNNVIVRWEAPTAAGADAIYSVQVENIFDEVIFKTETNKQHVKLNFDSKEMANEGLYIFSVKLKGNDEIKSIKYGIKRVTAEDAASLVSNYNGLKKELNENESALNKLIYASFFEENGMLLDALTKYEEAMQMSPNVADFKELYTAFLVSNGLAVDK